MARPASVLKVAAPGAHLSMSTLRAVRSAIEFGAELPIALRWQGGNSWMRLVAVGVTVLPLAACSGSVATADSQVVATVNGAKLTAAQLQQAQLPFFASQHSNTHTLDTLIDEELLVQEAHKAKLDADVAVQQEIERATRKILGEAYVAREITPRITVSTEEMRGFYDHYPALFKRRRIFEFAEFAVATAALTTQLRAEIAQIQSADELRNKFNRRAVKYVASKQAMTAEQLPMERMPELAKMVVGDVLLMPQDATVTRVLVVTAIAEDPQAFAQVQPRIEQYLVNRRAYQLLLDHLKLVRATATIAVPRVTSSLNAKPVQVAEDSPVNGVFQLGAVSRTEATHAAP